MFTILRNTTSSAITPNVARLARLRAQTSNLQQHLFRQLRFAPQALRFIPSVLRFVPSTLRLQSCTPDTTATTFGIYALRPTLLQHAQALRLCFPTTDFDTPLTLRLFLVQPSTQVLGFLFSCLVLIV